MNGSVALDIQRGGSENNGLQFPRLGIRGAGWIARSAAFLRAEYLC